VLVAIEKLTQEELLNSLISNHITIADKVYRSTWRITKGTKATLLQSIKDKTLLLRAVKYASALLDGKNIIYNPALIMYSHIFCSKNSQIQAYLHLCIK
jgi:hypothetical protein